MRVLRETTQVDCLCFIIFDVPLKQPSGNFFILLLKNQDFWRQN